MDVYRPGLLLLGYASHRGDCDPTNLTLARRVRARPCSNHRSLVAGDCPFEFDFRAKTLEIPVDHSDGQLPATASVRDRTVQLIQFPVYLYLVELLGVTHIGE